MGFFFLLSLFIDYFSSLPTVHVDFHQKQSSGIIFDTSWEY